MVDYLSINALMAGISGGIIGAIIILLTTITGVLGYSNAAKWLEMSVWGKYGYRVSLSGAVWGACLGFIYGFLIWWVFSIIYNVLI